MTHIHHLAPIVLFTYNRYTHTQQTVTALAQNSFAKNSHLIVYSDGAKNKNDKEAVLKTRTYLKKIEGFKSLSIIEQAENCGLANNIIEGVSAVVAQYGKVIVLEDDILVAPNFLAFMNEALEYYEHNAKIWHITGYSYPVRKSKFKNKSMVFSRLMDCWGWATWKDRWQYFEKNPQHIIDTFSPADITNFNLNIKGTAPFWSQIILNQTGHINTWAIFWYATIFINRGLCVFPINSFVKNIGLDGSGEHCVETTRYDSDITKNIFWQFSDVIKANRRYTKEIYKFYASNNDSKLLTLLKLIIRFFKKSNKEKLNIFLRILSK